MFFVYILKSLINAKSYTGFTGNLLSQRLYDHNVKRCRWTSVNGPFKLLYYESYHCKSDALHRENFLKSGQGRKLVKLIVDNY